MSQHNLFAFTEPTPTGGYPGFLSLNRQEDGTVTMTVRSPGHGGNQVGTVALPEEVLRKLRDSLHHDALGFPGSGG